MSKDNMIIRRYPLVRTAVNTERFMVEGLLVHHEFDQAAFHRLRISQKSEKHNIEVVSKWVSYQAIAMFDLPTHKIKICGVTDYWHVMFDTPVFSIKAGTRA